MIRLAPGVRLRPPPNRRSTARWLAVDLPSGHESLLSDVDALVALAFGKAADPRHRTTEIADVCGVPVSTVDQVVARLRVLGVLLPADDPDARHVGTVMAEWYSQGWRAAFDYHLACAGQTPPRSAVPCVPPIARAEQLPRDLTDALYGPYRPHITTAEDLRVLLAHGFGAAGQASPVRAYVLACDVGGLSPGTYRYDGALLRVADLPDAGWRRAALHGPLRVQSRPAALLVLTARWASARANATGLNGYRDAFASAGLMAAAIDFAGRARSVRVRWHHGTDDRLIHELLGLDGSGLAEGVLVGGVAGQAKG